MLSAAGQLDAGHSADAPAQPQTVDVGLPVVDAIVLGGRRELDVLGGDVDEAVGGVAVVVAAGRGVRVVVGADPAGGVDRPLERRRQLDGFALAHLDGLLNQIELGPVGDADQVVTGWNLLVDAAVVRLILMVAAVGAVVGAEVR